MSDSKSNGSTTGGSTKHNADDGAFQLQISDHPGMALVLSPLTGPNYLTWSAAIKTSLEAKDKMGFIDGTLLEHTNAAQYRRWKKVDSMVKAWIGNSVSKDIADTLVCCISTKKLWDELAKRYGRKCGSLLHKIQRELSSIQQGSDLVATCYGKLHRGWDELDQLVPLPGEILNMTPLPADVVAFNMVANVESERVESKKANSNKRVSANLVGTSSGSNQDSEQKKDGASKNSELANMVSMLFKQEMGKYLKVKEPEEHANYANILNFVGNSFNHSNDNYLSLMHGSWILDTGASSHMCSDFSLMQHIKSLQPPIKVHLPDSATKIVNTKGQVTLHPKLALHDVLYIPTFKFNLLSVCKLVKETDLHLTFHKNYCIVQDLKSKEVLAVAGVRRNLYVLEYRSFDPIAIKEAMSSHDLSFNITCIVLHTIKENISILWHQRLGHNPLSVITHIPSLSKSTKKDIPVCDTFHLSKQHRLPFPTSQTRANKPLELLHVDTQVPQILETFLKQIQNKYDNTVKIVHTDNGTEFLSAICQNVFAKLDWKTPFEVLNGSKPDYSRIRVFGSLCFVSNNVPHKDKFEERAHKCVFVGYVSGQKAYKAHDLTTHKIHVSRDIVFYESVFPFHHAKSVENFLNTPLVPILNEDSDYPSQILTNPSPTPDTEHHATSQPITDTNNNLSPISPTDSTHSFDSPVIDHSPSTTESSSSHTDPPPLI
ncbi:Retrovirus-related Pol polyprotein from transposon RE2 [Senna tora]|uniref:Retrovirus-related Pol polyprotein from transposon RE2 n=1 Tax=Senna tora TaxID=362788 RepID=A0A834WRI4_9FABA|nr:Retrovirus-related Pol polyprotein from transposon RE2 [Senna tora]